MLKQNKVQLFLISCLAVIFLTVLIGTALAQEYTPQITIPGSKFVKGQKVTVQGNLVGEYIAALYKFLVGIAGILAVLMITLGGLMWLFSGGSAEKIGKAKETIMGAVVGLMLALGSYLILNTINPKLVDFSLSVPPVLVLSTNGCCLMTDKQSTWGILDFTAHDYYVAEKMSSELECLGRLNQTLNAYTYWSAVPAVIAGVAIPIPTLREFPFTVDNIQYMAGDVGGLYYYTVEAKDRWGTDCKLEMKTSYTSPTTPGLPAPDLDETVCCQYQNECYIISRRECRGYNGIEYSPREEYQCFSGECRERE